MRNRFMLALTAALIAVVAIGGIVLATPSSGVTSTTIATGSLDPVNLIVKNGDWMTQLRTKGQSSLTVVENDVAPGGTFGWHSHPGPSLIIVKSGTLTFYRADDPSCTPEIHSAGEAFVDPGTDVHIGRNDGSVVAVVIVTRLLPAGAPARIDQPDPGTCAGL
jgi:quercetin dioxygenase-like cupin family protein